MSWVSELQHPFCASSWEVLEAENHLWESRELSTLQAAPSTGLDCSWQILAAQGL